MNNFLKQNVFFQRKIVILIFMVLLVAYFLLRLPNLTLQPIFADEAIYVRWAQVMRAEPTMRFLPLFDGKTPLFMWVMIPFLKIFSDPLFAGRFLSILSGLATAFGVLFLSWRLFGIRSGLWALLFMVITPYIVFFDRMALVDSMLSAFSIWALNISLLLIKYQRTDLAMALGYILGGGLLTKTPGFFNVLLIPTTLIAFDWKGKGHQQKIIKIFFLWVMAIIITLVAYNILRLGPGFENLSSRNQDYIHSPLILFQHPLDPFVPHFRDLIDWLPKMLTWPILLLVFGGIVLAVKKRNQWALVIIFWAMIPLTVEMLLLKTFTARYILFCMPPLLVLGAWTLDSIISKTKRQGLAIAMAIVIILPLALNFDLLLLSNPANAPLPREERRGYFEDWTAGYGFPEIAKFLQSQAKSELVVVGTEGSFGTLSDGLWIYLDKTPNVVVIGGKATISAQLRQAAKDHPTFFVSNTKDLLDKTAGVELLFSYPKAKSEDGVINQNSLFRIYPEGNK